MEEMMLDSWFDVYFPHHF